MTRYRIRRPGSVPMTRCLLDLVFGLCVEPELLAKDFAGCCLTLDIVLSRLPRIPLHDIKLLLGNSHTTKPGVVDHESPHSVDIFLC